MPRRRRRSIYDYWWKCVPRALAAKEQSGLSDNDIAQLLNKKFSRKAGRAQVNHFFNGKREPTINQFFLLCSIMEADPKVILFDVVGEWKQASQEVDGPPDQLVHFEQAEEDENIEKPAKRFTSRGGRQRKHV